MNPTQEQIKEVFEWCLKKPIELRWGFWDYCEYFSETQSRATTEKLGSKQELCYLKEKTDYFEDWQLVPPTDLNNLFKWAVPKLKRGVQLTQTDDGWQCDIGLGDIVVCDKDPALALFNAIYKLIKEDKDE